jgi:hypothetical protein
VDRVRDVYVWNTRIYIYRIYGLERWYSVLSHVWLVFDDDGSH